MIGRCGCAELLGDNISSSNLSVSINRNNNNNNMTEASSINTSDDAASSVDQGSQPDMQLFYSSRTTGSSNLLDNVENSNSNDHERLSPPTHKRRLSASHRRRQRPVHQMESISETGFGDAADNHLDLESFFVSGQHTTTVNTHDTVSSNESTSSSSSSVRRRRSIPVSSAGSSSGSRTGSTRRRRLGQDFTNQAPAEHAGNTHDTQRRSGSSSTGLSTSLDAGMKSLRKWIRSHKFASNVDSAETSSGQSSTMRLGEEDISALSRAGNDTVPVTTTASSASGDSSSNLFQHGGDNGFLYYRPNDVHLRHDADDDLDSTDLFFPLVNLSQEGGLRNRAYSEPDRTQVAGFFLNSVYSSRAIDTGGARDESSSPVSQSVTVTDSSVSVIEEGNTTTHQEPEHIQSFSTLQLSNDHTSVSASNSVHTTVDNDTVAESRANFESTSLSGPADEGNINDTGTETIIDPDRDARMRWLQINRRFRCIISSVALAFSFLLVLFFLTWAVLIATYILSLPKTCDVPLKAYFWLATLQLALDFFRAEIMKWMCRWRTNSRGGVPLRVLLYNIAYLIYAMLVLRLGITSVFVKESTCYDTAPELFLASAVFVSLTLLAWALIIVGYGIPYATVAVLLTRNGYFPNEDLDALNDTEGNRRARLLGILPNNLANPAPPDCAEKLRVVMFDEFNDSFQKECCICLIEYREGDGIVATPCDHIFHKTCCKEWLQLSRSCPICRRDIVDGLDEGFTLEEGAVDSRRSNNPTERRTSREWQRDASNLLQFLRRSPRATSETSNGN